MRLLPKKRLQTLRLLILDHFSTPKYYRLNEVKPPIEILVFLFFPDFFHVWRCYRISYGKSQEKYAGISTQCRAPPPPHCFAAHTLENREDIRAIRKLPGHADVKSAEIYTHVMAGDIRPPDRIRLSPLFSTPSKLRERPEGQSG
jgi:integrase